METNSPAVSYRSHLQQQVGTGRQTLLGVILFTVINLVLLMTNGDTYLLFSASVPYYLVWFGRHMDAGLQGGTFAVTGLVVAAVILAVYLLIWLLSGRKGTWLWIALVLLCLDLAVLVAMALLSENLGGSLVDILIHIVAIYQIGKGASAWKTLQNQPPDLQYTVITDDL